jgi:hypothetical protein
MTEDFAHIVEFLNRFQDEVQGRDLMYPDPELRQRLDRFARGECSQSEQGDLCQMLTRHPEWVVYLAECIKGLRGAPAGSNHR